MKENLSITIKGHLHITDDLGNVLLDKKNAIHPQNMARVISRALSNEDNYFIHRIAYGNGGTVVDPTGLVSFKTPNDGLSPDQADYRSRLYNETYSEIVDDSDTLIGTDPGSTEPDRPGGGSVPSGDPASIEHVSGPGVRSQELGVISQVVISSVINPTEPTGQIVSDQDPNPGSSGDSIEDPEGTFVFDELGLYTTGAGSTASSAYHQVDVGNKTAQDDTGLISGTTYSFKYDAGSGDQATSVTPIGSGTGSPPTVSYQELVDELNLVFGSHVVASITNNDVIPAENTFGFLQFTTTLAGSVETITVDNDGATPLFTALGQPDPTTNNVPIPGEDAGVQNNAAASDTERERLLTHVVFSPITKTANRTISMTYTLIVSVARST